MDYQFPRQLFPSFYNRGPPGPVLNNCAANWGSYDGVIPQGDSGALSSWTFTSRHQVRAEPWHHTEPVPIPLFSPKKSFFLSSTPPDPLEFTEHMQNFFMDNCQDSFGCMSEILGENFNFKQGLREHYRLDPIHTRKIKMFMELLKLKICQQTYYSRSMEACSALLSDVRHDIPPELLGTLLFEELTEQRNRQLFFEGATGGALSFVPFSQSGRGSQHGCLLYPGNQGMDHLYFHRVALQPHKGPSLCVDSSSNNPLSFQLKGPIRQISSASLLNYCCAAVRLDYLCGVWSFNSVWNESNTPHLLQVITTREVTTCVNVSPHILGEVLVASESGAINLWTVGKGMQKVREEDNNLYFNAKSAWRWCEFSAHPRIMLYADRTGAELSDIRVSPASSHTLFRISNTVKCRSGERLILSKYLGDIHSFHHLITTQYSAYIMDERFPCMPMLKWDHMMQSPPMFCHVPPGPASSGQSGGVAKPIKVLLGSQGHQEITLLQYSGGRVETCSSHGPPQALLRPRDSLKFLPVQLPHRLDTATNRLSSPASGLTCIQNTAGRTGSDDCMCILQLTEAGDIFYQILKHEQQDISQPPAAEDEPLLQNTEITLPQSTLKKATKSGRKTAKPHQVTQPVPQLVPVLSSSEIVIGSAQHAAVQRFVAETPKKSQQDMYSDESSENSGSGRKQCNLKQLCQKFTINSDPELNVGSGVDSGVKDIKIGNNNGVDLENLGPVNETVSSLNCIVPPGQQTPIKLTKDAVVRWKVWLQKVTHRRPKTMPHPHCLETFKITTSGLLNVLNDKARHNSEEDHLQSLKQELRACMSSHLFLVSSAISPRSSDIVPLPNLVDTGVWSDQLSQRLTLSWQGGESWRAWWDDQLGLNREEKVKALRRRRRREKEAKRATGQSLELCRSFTSSVSYQSALDCGSWSSVTSQGAWSDTEWLGLPQLGSPGECWTSSDTIPSTMQSQTAPPKTTVTHQRVEDNQNEQLTPSSSHDQSLTLKTLNSSASQRRGTCPADDYPRSHFTPQDESSERDGYFLEKVGTMDTMPQPVVSSQLHHLLSVPNRSPRTDPSLVSTRSGFSQSLPPSQSSQGRAGLSQGSQPKKKKSRMGF
ncbi:uncharacterized protein taf1c [Aulostomus maculatus]